ncbi:MAG TPA: hypothetical protein VFX89_10565 [Gammaproteobacteria bacterium]|nr:hypothetical protein [Gammaproteobacteria bacterium]
MRLPRINAVRIAFTLSVLGLLSAVSLGQETPAPSAPPAAQPSPAPAASQPAPAQPQSTPGKPPSVTPAAGAPVTPRTPSKDDDFIPTEELGADEEVTFPVDI